MALSISFFLLRLLTAGFYPQFSRKRWVKNVARSIDSVLLLSGAIYIYFLFTQGIVSYQYQLAGVSFTPMLWLGIKMLLLVMYILTGLIAIDANRRNHYFAIPTTARWRIGAAAVAMVCIFSLLFVAARNPWHPFEFVPY